MIEAGARKTEREKPRACVDLCRSKVDRSGGRELRRSVKDPREREGEKRARGVRKKVRSGGRTGGGTEREARGGVLL